METMTHQIRFDYNSSCNHDIYFVVDFVTTTTRKETENE